MERRKYITLRVTRKVKELYKRISYRKAVFFERFYEKHKGRLFEYTNVVDTITKLPPSITGCRYSITAPVNVKEKEHFKAFIGYMILKLIENKGEIEKALSSIRRELNGVQ